MVNRKYIFMGLVIILMLGLGCIDKKSGNENASTHTPTPVVTVTPVTTDIATKVVTENKNDTKFIELFKESIVTLQAYTTKIEKAAKDNKAQDIKTNSQYLESDAGKYISELEKLTVSSNMTDIYNEYKKRLGYVKTSGERCTMAIDRYEQGGSTDEATTNLNKCTEYVVEAMKRLNQTTEKN